MMKAVWLEKYDLFYFRVDNSKLKVTTVFPGLTIQYSTDGKTWKDVGDDTRVEGNIKFRTR